MNLPAFLFALVALTRETCAHARAAGLTWGLFAITALCTLFCFSVSVHGDMPILETKPHEDQHLLPNSEARRLNLTEDFVRGEGVDVPTGELRLFFGAVRVPIERSGSHSVRLIQVILAGGVADTAGILLALLWTASFLPTFLEQSCASVVLAKPLPRWCLLWGKTAGILVVVGAQSLLFIGATWLALGIRTGAWDLRYFLALPVLLMHFAVFFSISVVLAVWFRSAVVCALGTIAAWALCFAVNLARHDSVLKSSTENSPFIETAYWLLPKPADYNLILADALNVDDYFRRAVDMQALMAKGAFAPELTLLTGVGFAVAALLCASRKFARTDY